MAFIPSEHAFPKRVNAVERSVDTSAAETTFWEDIRDDLQPCTHFNLNRDLSVREGFGYEVRHYYKSPSGDVEIFPGAQGVIVGVPPPDYGHARGYAKVHVPELDQVKIVPMVILRTGNVHIEDRNLYNEIISRQGILASKSGQPFDQLNVVTQAYLLALAATNVEKC
ncbi:hypothetical protein J4E80_007446 [Alternaria sp. BMP 0032]|nr:hypothetical protein J4E80_007446 [Alternaria sp. BMP 0032]